MRTGSDSTRILDENYNFGEIGKGRILRDGKDITIMGCGVTTGRALNAAGESLEKMGISCRVVNMSTIKPIDSKMITKCAEETKAIITAEDHNIIGGLGSAVAEVLAKNKPTLMGFIGVNDTFGGRGEPDELAKYFI